MPADAGVAVGFENDEAKRLGRRCTLSEHEQTTETGRPLIERINARIANLERQLDWLDERIEGGKGSEAALNHDRANRAAIKAALRSMRSSDKLLLALAELADAIDVDAFIADHDLEPRTNEAIERAHDLVAEWADT